ncbi:DNA replication licensing factor MCM3-like protein [Leptotrombidium deliense]|uniref:DNA replication licensing factor MCM3 n=1 Tax=Leptotrombidium deliense TaxID=299467 RepID=A0A443SS98_9ACAR|nr:DNA replication licensing factor MCM3-like protein [Leptotrombidium deliense]
MDAMDLDIDVNLRDIQREYVDFLDDEAEKGNYTRMIKDMITNKEQRLIVNINDVRRSKPLRAAALINNAVEELVAFEAALKEVVNVIDHEYLNMMNDVFIGLEGSFGRKHVTPRTLSTHFLGNLVCVEGIVTKLSLVRPKVVKSVHYCPATKKYMERKYTDLTSYESYPSSSVYPTKDDEGNLLETEYGLSVYKDHQSFTIQEMPEKAPPGQLPRSVDIIADNDLVDQCKPGDRVQVVGTFRCLPSKQGNYSNGTFRTIIIANNIKMMSKEVSPLISSEDVQKCKRFSRQKHNVFDLLARSLAPSIHGHELIKKALLCMLLGGVEKVLPNGTRLRGDINILLIGDPSVAKSQLLRYVLHSAPRAIPTTGRGSSGVGLTAAVTTDFETGERRLEAGAMVLADRGVVCIDEFDKMSDIDRTAIHEVMEQGRVTITKAGIHAKLNARCSVLAAANPVYGRYEEHKTPMENIGLQDSLLSRFDLLFIMLDKSDTDIDQNIADHVVRMHRYRSPTEQDGEPLPIVSTADFLSTKDLEACADDSETPIYEKYDTMLHGNRPRSEKIVSVKFMKKYIHIAKMMKPVITDEAGAAIAEAYAELRCFETENSDLAKTQPVTARTLETMIRLATAHAKARLSRNVEVQDSEAAIELIHFAYFKKVLDKKKKRKEYSSDAEGSENEDEDVDMDEDDEVTVPLTPSRRKRLRKEPPEVLESIDETQRAEEADVTVELPSVSDDRLKKFKTALFNEFRKLHAQSLPLQQILESITKDGDEENPFGILEIKSCLHLMQEANQVMLADDIVFLI